MLLLLQGLATSSVVIALCYLSVAAAVARWVWSLGVVEMLLDGVTSVLASLFRGSPALRAPALLTRSGVECEEHWVVTEDGFVLSLFRVGACKSKPAVLLLPALFQDCEAFLVGNESFATWLSVHGGFDVWVGNFRGSRYGARNVAVSRREDAFWKFSYEEHGRLDVPALVDKVLRVTGASTLSIVGYSQGCAAAIVALSSAPEMAGRVNHLVGLAPPVIPVGFQSFSIGPSWVARLFGRREALAIVPIVHRLVSPSVWAALAEMAMRAMFGWRHGDLAPEDKPELFQHVFSPSSSRAVEHWMQSIQDGRLGFFRENIDDYSPEFSARDLPCPTTWIGGGADTVLSMKGLRDAVPPGSPIHVLEGMEHLDLLWGKSAPARVFPLVAKHLRRTVSPPCMPHSSNELSSPAENRARIHEEDDDDDDLRDVAPLSRDSSPRSTISHASARVHSLTNHAWVLAARDAALSAMMLRSPSSSLHGTSHRSPAPREAAAETPRPQLLPEEALPQ
jgi:lysosomal acid lipase/cholesteryl ester hydrolase